MFEQSLRKKLKPSNLRTRIELNRTQNEEHENSIRTEQIFCACKELESNRTLTRGI